MVVNIEFSIPAVDISEYKVVFLIIVRDVKYDVCFVECFTIIVVCFGVDGPALIANDVSLFSFCVFSVGDLCNLVDIFTVNSFVVVDSIRLLDLIEVPTINILVEIVLCCLEYFPNEESSEYKVDISKIVTSVTVGIVVAILVSVERPFIVVFVFKAKVAFISVPPTDMVVIILFGCFVEILSVEISKYKVDDLEFLATMVVVVM